MTGDLVVFTCSNGEEVLRRKWPGEFIGALCPVGETSIAISTNSGEVKILDIGDVLADSHCAERTELNIETFGTLADPKDARPWSPFKRRKKK